MLGRFARPAAAGLQALEVGEDHPEVGLRALVVDFQRDVRQLDQGDVQLALCQGRERQVQLGVAHGQEGRIRETLGVVDPQLRETELTRQDADLGRTEGRVDTESVGAALLDGLLGDRVDGEGGYEHADECDQAEDDQARIRCFTVL